MVKDPEQHEIIQMNRTLIQWQSNYFVSCVFLFVRSNCMWSIGFDLDDRIWSSPCRVSSAKDAGGLMTCSRSLWRTELGLIVVQSGTSCDAEDWWKLTVFSSFNSYCFFSLYIITYIIHWYIICIQHIHVSNRVNTVWIMSVFQWRSFTSPNEMLHNICTEWDILIYSKLLQWLARCTFRSRRIATAPKEVEAKVAKLSEVLDLLLPGASEAISGAPSLHFYMMCHFTFVQINGKSQPFEVEVPPRPTPTPQRTMAGFWLSHSLKNHRWPLGHFYL